ncbi:MAG: hypothetical protein HFI19_01810 [Lachnospiraceae bacterium]|jgi:hypothetical protein|uniref:hypothetical protein n=1 Tax=Candidatus Merdisoma sp. JLR.KK006 TaxID=3112626 RepID=UPI002FF1E700|nr:hypothetical protein [Lachnospiraceae bacterium]
MKKKVFVLYDDRIRPNEKIAQVAGNKTYGSIIFKQKTIQRRVEEVLQDKDYILKFCPFSEEKKREESIGLVLSASQSTSVVYLFSSYGILDPQMFGLLLDKTQFLNQSKKVTVNKNTAALLFADTEQFREWVKKGSNPEGNEEMEALLGDMLIDLNSFDEFIQYITSGFDARFFNTLEGDQYTVTKRSANREKIKNEYQFYYFLPREMQHWFVQPYSYEESDQMACYTMERMHMTDLAIQYVHGAVSTEDLDQILCQLFYFLRTRCTKKITKEEYDQQSKHLYLDKVLERLAGLKKSSYFEKMNGMIGVGTFYKDIDAVFSHYEDLYRKIHEKYTFEPLATVSHGDLCFSNILYQRHANILRMIDPKGATEESDIWMDPWYDLAKLSHSICGRYDFFNSSLYQVKIGEDLKLELQIDFENQAYIEVFQRYLEENQFSYPVVRLYEASLFLSMLPLHMDNPQKVFGFLLNGIEILQEVERCLKD